MEKREDERLILYEDPRVFVLKSKTNTNLYVFSVGGWNNNRPKTLPETAVKREPHHFANFGCVPSPFRTHRPQTKWKTMEQLDFFRKVFATGCICRGCKLARAQQDGKYTANAKSNCSIVFHFVCGLCVWEGEGEQSKFTKW